VREVILTTDLATQLGDLITTLGGDLWGVADLTGIAPLPGDGERVDLMPYPRAVSIAVIFPRAIVQELLRGPSHTYLYEYNILNTRLDDIALRVSNTLQVAGYTSYPVPASQRNGGDHFQSIFSHRLAARLAGLGWIGKNCCLVTPQYGPRVRLVTVLTGAPLATGSPITRDCGDCTECVDACPPGAIKGALFRIDQPLRDRFDAAACTTHKDKVRDRWGKRCCGLCLASCPIGQ
ncbi:MAG: epoxyqueuosine reductase, partial [Chloroflexota bacterium]|nr:epoxyqueuosine reductase [Chloroflexota bacterium]